MKLTILLLQLAIIAILLYQLKQPAIKPITSTRIVRVEQDRLSDAILKQLDSLRIPVKRVTEVRHTAGIIRQTITTQLRDSVVTDTVKVRVFCYADRYMRLDGLARGDTQQVRVAITDTLLQVVHKGKRKYPWLWIFSPRELLQTVRLANPNATITYDEQIKVE